jgi:hypothetical protein
MDLRICEISTYYGVKYEECVIFDLRVCLEMLARDFPTCNASNTGRPAGHFAGYDNQSLY